MDNNAKAKAAMQEMRAAGFGTILWWPDQTMLGIARTGEQQGEWFFGSTSAEALDEAVRWVREQGNAPNSEPAEPAPKNHYWITLTAEASERAEKWCELLNVSRGAFYSHILEAVLADPPRIPPIISDAMLLRNLGHHVGQSGPSNDDPPPEISGTWESNR